MELVVELSLPPPQWEPLKSHGNLGGHSYVPSPPAASEIADTEAVFSKTLALAKAAGLTDYRLLRNSGVLVGQFNKAQLQQFIDAKLVANITENQRLR